MSRNLKAFMKAESCLLRTLLNRLCMLELVPSKACYVLVVKLQHLLFT